ncbi:MAG: hypothetical protein Q7T97_18675 [Burkholderiaceae bacterium]|nr:hypothetical protein [Burkholderiaceae bacterium]
MNRLTLDQHLLASIFLLGYGAALGSMFSTRGRLRAATLALLAAVAFAARTHPWEHGVLLVGCAIGGVAVFIVLAWMLSRVATLSGMPAGAVPARNGRARQLSDELRGSALHTAQNAAQAARRRRRRARIV